jgi:hypothetical protein
LQLPASTPPYLVVLSPFFIPLSPVILLSRHPREGGDGALGEELVQQEAGEEDLPPARLNLAAAWRDSAATATTPPALGLCRISRSGGRPGRRERRRRPGRGRGDDGSGGSGRAHRPRHRTPPGGGRISPGANPAAAA